MEVQYAAYLAGRRDDPRYQRLVAATRQAALRGYEAVSMRELATTTRMSLSTIYRLFTSKDHLIAEAHADGMIEFSDRVHRKPPRGATAEERVNRLCERIVAPLETDPLRTMTLMRALYSLEIGVGESRVSVRDAYARMVDLVIGDEEIPDREAVINTLGHVANSAMLEWMNLGESPDYVREVLTEAVHVLLGRKLSA